MVEDSNVTRSNVKRAKPSAEALRAKVQEQELLREEVSGQGLPPLVKPTNRSPRQMREERQARVGILRNLAKPSLPPAKRVSLTGRWLKMQSSRRPTRSIDGNASDSGKEDAPKRSFAQIVEEAAIRDGLILIGEDGIEAIDIAGLMASVNGIGRTPPLRKPFAPVLYDDPMEGVEVIEPPLALQTRASSDQTLSGMNEGDEEIESVKKTPSQRDTKARRHRRPSSPSISRKAAPPSDYKKATYAPSLAIEDEEVVIESWGIEAELEVIEAQNLAQKVQTAPKWRRLVTRILGA